jgi:predicted Fe-Mo cluster-binding NifX family protein
MKIGVTSQNFRTITGHAGKTRKFLVFSDDAQGQLKETQRLSLPKEMAMHEFRGTEHPVDALDILITASCGDGFLRKMSSRGVEVIVTSETDPVVAVTNLMAGLSLPPGLPHTH